MFLSMVSETLLGWKGSFVGKKWLKLWKAAPLCIFWSIWKEKNRIAFEKGEIYIQRLKGILLYVICGLGPRGLYVISFLAYFAVFCALGLLFVYLCMLWRFFIDTVFCLSIPKINYLILKELCKMLAQEIRIVGLYPARI